MSSVAAMAKTPSARVSRRWVFMPPCVSGGHDAQRLFLARADDVARAQLAPATALGLAIDRDGERPDQVLGLAARVDDAGELQQLAERDELARHLDVAHAYDRSGAVACAGRR